MFGLFRKKTLDDFLNETKKVKVKGLEFVIRKISPIDYLDGSKILQQSYALYQNNKASIDPMAEKKIKEFFSNVLCSAVVSPKIVHKADDSSGTHVERMFVDWEMVMQLYEEIMVFTYGKKKLKQNSSAGKSFLSLILFLGGMAFCRLSF